MKRNLLLLAALMIGATQVISAATIKGRVLDKETGAPLLGATVMVKGTTTGASTGLDGDFQIHAKRDQQIIISYISYVTQEIIVEKSVSDLTVNLVADSKTIASVQVVTKKNLETEANLQNERIASNVAIENIGVREMSLKGLSNVEDGVKKMTSISVADGGQIVVRGLGDRYSSTTLNGLPIASPNPDNKLAPLDIFPSSAVKNITVSKVYDAAAYADYSGAHIDIATKSLEGDKFFTMGFGVGGDFSTIGNDFYAMDNVSLFSKPGYDSSVTSSNFVSSIKSKEIFDTDFNVTKSSGMPSLKGNVGWGDSFKVGEQKLSALVTAGIDHDNESMDNCKYSYISATGDDLKRYDYDEYTSSLDIAALASLGMTLRDKDYIGYTLFYARNASNEYNYKYNAFDDDKNIDNYSSSNGFTRIYGMMSNQLHGLHKITDKLDLNWSGAYTTTSSESPDCRQAMLYESGDKFFFYNETGDGTNRYYSELSENEYSGEVSFDYDVKEGRSVSFGAAYKGKSRDFEATNFTYNMGSFGSSTNSPSPVEDIYNLSDYISLENLKAGKIGASMSSGAADRYTAESSIMAAFATTSLQLSEKLLVDLGLRVENAEQSVTCSMAAFGQSDKTYVIDGVDFFPALNVKYQLEEKRQIRLALSRTITRPSFLEMAPYEYRESFGSPIVKGNEEIENGYNYNADLRYESFFKGGDMFSLTAYYKYLDTPIERVEKARSGAVLYSFDNIDSGMAAGFEFEARKKLVGDLRLGVNGSYMYTKVNLTPGSSYTNKERDLQGASPYLLNVDLTYTPRINDKALSLALLYNLQGPRIHAVGRDTRGDVIQRAVNLLNFNASYEVSKKITVGAKLTNLLSLPYIFDQEMVQTGKTYVVEEYNPGVSGQISVSMKF